MKNRRFQRGQATAELTIALIAVMAVVSGFLLIAQLGRANLDSLLEAKAKADINSINGIPGATGSPIRYWDDGNDNLEYSPDDEAQTMTNDDGALFNSQLRTQGFSLSSDLGSYALNNFAKTLGVDYIFLPAANLTSATENVTVDIDDASRFLYGGNSLFGLRTINIENSIYMPIVAK